MSAAYKTAMGKQVNMEALRAKNENVRAVGNMNVNARGDTIDSYGRVINDNTHRVNEHYGKTVGNRGVQATPQQYAQQNHEMSAAERELLEDNFTRDDLVNRK